MPAGRRAALVVLVALAAGCGNTHLSRVPASAAQLPEGVPLARPALVLVRDFATDAGEVQLDSGVRSRLLALVSGGSPDTRRVDVANAVRSVATETLVARIQEMGLRAEGAGRSIEGEPRGPVVTVTGQVLDVDQGNRTRRTLIGFGAGKSDVGADVQVYYRAPGTANGLLAAFSADSDSGHMPGAAVTLGAGAAAGHVAASALASGGLHAASEHRTDSEREAEKLAGGVADSLRKVFAARGWVAVN